MGKPFLSQKTDLCDCQPAWSSTPSLSSGIKYGQNVFHDGWERSFVDLIMVMNGIIMVMAEFRKRYLGDWRALNSTK